ncbi:Hypothetical_protein [Hexamita inflata]|uniref:Hypothetical_protein n=1 Tax=Hexamita inflata TaxID=28002 RepID=A0AA86TT37_9EUKA|nr:Hypothetical protein HINF_LOCUS15599 [Hexamita inflata]
MTIHQSKLSYTKHYKLISNSSSRILSLNSSRLSYSKQYSNIFEVVKIQRPTLSGIIDCGLRFNPRCMQNIVVFQLYFLKNGQKPSLVKYVQPSQKPSKPSVQNRKTVVLGHLSTHQTLVTKDCKIFQYLECTPTCVYYRNIMKYWSNRHE